MYLMFTQQDMRVWSLIGGVLLAWISCVFKQWLSSEKLSTCFIHLLLLLPLSTSHPTSSGCPSGEWLVLGHDSEVEVCKKRWCPPGEAAIDEKCLDINFIRANCTGPGELR